MKEPTRLFDLPEYQLQNKSLPNMLAAKKGGEWVHYSTKQFSNTVVQLATSFIERGMGYQEWTPDGRDKIAIISENRPEWMMVDHACQQSGAILVPIYPTINEDELLQILNEAEVKWIFVSNLITYKKVKHIQAQASTLQKIFSFEEIPEVSHWSSLLTKARKEDLQKIKKVKKNTKPEDLVTIIYTSGTSGNPKGVMLSHDNILSNVFSGYKCLPIQQDGKALSFLPLNHVYERMITYLYIYASVPIYFAENMGTIGENLKEVSPYIFATVPRLLESVYEKILDKGHQLTGLKRKLFFWALDIGNKYELHKKQSLGYRLQLSISNKLVFSKWRQALGGQVTTIVTGSAACQRRLLRLFSAAGIVILEGYGLTETSPVVSVNRMEKENRRFGTIGPLINGVQVKLSSEGEILCKGPNIMMGYYKHPQLTQEVIEDGWFKTGDIGEWVEGKFLKITDRKKELFKISGGKYVAPLPIETKMTESSFIRQIMVVGSNEKFVGALIVPDYPKIAQQLKFEEEETALIISKIAQSPEVYQLIKNEIKTYNKQFNPWEQIKKFRLLQTEWTIEKGELTPTLKLKRRVIYQKYKEVISSIYE